MKCWMRIALCSIAFVACVLFLTKKHLEEIWDQYSVKDYIVDSVFYYVPEEIPDEPEDLEWGDKVIVMARLEEENTDWVKDELPEWDRAVYIVNPSSSSVEDPNVLTTPTNKGNEAMAYLTYIIDHYDSLPSNIIFLHSHRSGFFQAWHVDAPLHDNVAAMQSLDLHYIQTNGYVNLRCNWNPGCKKAHRQNKHVTEEVWNEVFRGTSTPPLSSLAAKDTDFDQAPENQAYLSVPEEVGAACCAQFAVSSRQVHKRPRSDYVQFRKWLMDTDRDDAHSGRIMEFLWHIIFGKNSVYCPEAYICYCKVYGRC